MCRLDRPRSDDGAGRVLQKEGAADVEYIQRGIGASCQVFGKVFGNSSVAEDGRGADRSYEAPRRIPSSRELRSARCWSGTDKIDNSGGEGQEDAQDQTKILRSSFGRGIGFFTVLRGRWLPGRPALPTSELPALNG